PTALSNYSPNVHIYQAIDDDTTAYFVIKRSKYNTLYLEEDTVELNIMEKGFMEGAGFERIERKYLNIDGLPGLFATYKQKSSNKIVLTTYAIKGASVYLVSAWCQGEEQTAKARKAIESFKFVTVVSKQGKLQTDSIHKFSVSSPWPLPPDVNTYNFSF